jgi:act minimal PKS acyl carrier protein
MTIPQTRPPAVVGALNEFTVEDVKELMAEVAGVDERVDLNGDIGDTPFEDLGYDSLSLLEMCGRVERVYGTPIPDEAIYHMNTPNAAAAYIDARMKGRG